MAKAVTIVKDDVDKVFKSIRELIGKQVLVGIPQARNPRKGAGPSNALIGYTMEFGSPAQNIPARAFLIPGVKNARPAALRQLRMAADAALIGDMKLMESKLNAAGVVASNEVRLMISSNIPPPLAPATIRGRARARGTKRRESEQVYHSLIGKGISPGAAQAEVGIVSLINTGQLRNSITYVIRKL